MTGANGPTGPGEARPAPALPEGHGAARAAGNAVERIIPLHERHKRIHGLPPFQALVDAAPAGSVLRPKPGAYAGPVKLSKPLTIDGGGQVSIDAGGKGTVWIDGLYYSDNTYRLTPSVEASSTLPGYAPDHALDLSPDTSWRSTAGDEAPWLLIDFLQEREYGGLIIQWEEGFAPEQFRVETSPDGSAWETAYVA